MVGRAGRGAERENLFLQERDHAIVGQDRRRCLIQERLVGRTSPLGDEQELIGLLMAARAVGIDFDLRRHVRFGVGLLEHGQRRQLRVAQVALDVGVARPSREGCLVVAVGEDVLALLAHDDGGAGVLAHRQHAARRDIGVLEEVVGHELVVGRGFLVVQDRAELREMARSQQVVDVGKGRLGELAQSALLNDQHFFSQRLAHRDAGRRDFAVRRLVLPQRKERCVFVGRGGGWLDGDVHGTSWLICR